MKSHGIGKVSKDYKLQIWRRRSIRRECLINAICADVIAYTNESSAHTLFDSNILLSSRL